MGQQIFDFIRRGQTAELATALQDNPRLAQSCDTQGVSALMWAIYTHQRPVVELLRPHAGPLGIFEAAALGDCSRLSALLAADAMAAHAVAGDGWSALHLAAAFGTPEAVLLLIEHGAHVHQFSHNPLRNQPLHACLALDGSAATVKALIDAGADVNAVGAGDYTPLHLAAANNRVDVIGLLLQAGAKRDARCAQGKTAEDYARERGHEEVVRLLQPAA